MGPGRHFITGGKSGTYPGRHTYSLMDPITNGPFMTSARGTIGVGPHAVVVNSLRIFFNRVN